MSTLTAEPQDAKTLSELRIDKGWTQAEVGRLLGEKLGRKPYTHARIVQIEQGYSINSDQIEALASLYGVRPSQLLEAVKKLRE